MQIVSQIIKQSLVNWKSLKWLQSSKLKDIGEHGITKLKNSLKENNFVQPFNVWEDSKGVIWILDGHHREKALTQLEAEGYEIPETLPANFISCSDKKAAAKMVLLYSSIYAKITNEGLGEFLDDFDLDISNLINEIDLPGLDFDSILEPETLPEDIDEAPAPLEKTYSILGDVFEIDGKHRVMCGDSTKESDVSILMNGNKADMVILDPMFDMDYLTISNVESKVIVVFSRGAKRFPYLLSKIDDGYGYHNIVNIAAPFGVAEETLPTMLHEIIHILRKGGSYVFDHDLAKRYDEGKGVNNKKAVSILRDGRATQGEFYFSYAKPVNELCYLCAYTKPNNITLDLFLGSGSTLIAAETTKRICYGVEIDQHYSDVILRRYKKTFPNATFKCLTRNDFPFEELFNA